MQGCQNLDFTSGQKGIAKSKILKLQLKSVSPTLNVSSKFSMCIIFSIGYIKIYNIISPNGYNIQQFRIRTSKVTIQLSNNIKIHS